MDEWNGCSLSSVNKPLKPTESKVIFAHIETDAYNTNRLKAEDRVGIM